MNSTYRIFFLLSALSIFFSGCQTPQNNPDPRLTIVDGSQRQGQESADWINTTDLYGAGAADLEMRDSAFDQNSDSWANAANKANVHSSIYFDYDTSYIKPSERQKLAKIRTLFEENPGWKLLIEGHCDWRGTTEYNLALGDRRAHSVYSYLSQLGLSESRLETNSKGDLEATNDAAESQMAQERRADLILVK